MIQKLALTGKPIDQVACLIRKVRKILPLSVTRQIDYAGFIGDESSSKMGISYQTRLYTLQGWTTCKWYAITLSGIVSDAAALSDPFSPLPTVPFFCLSLARC